MSAIFDLESQFRSMSLTTRNDRSTNYLGSILRVLSHPAVQKMATAKTMQLLNSSGSSKKKKGGRKRAFAPAQASQVPVMNRAVAAPVAINTMRRQGGPRVRNASNNQSIRVRHSERFGSVPGSTTYALKSYSLQPALGTGLTNMFPWLAGLARQYEMYKVHSVSISFKTIAGTGERGHVIVAPDYDAIDTAPLTGVAIESFKSAVSGPVWQNLRCSLDPADLGRRSPKYCRTGALPLNADLKTYDTANIFVATDACADTAIVGYLYVDYDIELFTPANPATLELNSIRTAHYAFTENLSGLTGGSPGGGLFTYRADTPLKAHFDVNQPGFYQMTFSTLFSADPVMLPPSTYGNLVLSENSKFSGNPGQNVGIYLFNVGVRTASDGITISLTNWFVGGIIGVTISAISNDDYYLMMTNSGVTHAASED